MTVTEYVERVRAALADLPPRVRDELLDDLPEHLAEVAAESDEPLEARLGPPEAYAAELRAAADVAPAGGPSAGVRLAAALAEVRDRLRGADARIGRILGYDTASAFVRQLRPGWWVLRGYLVAMLVAYLVNPDRGSIGLLPRLGQDADIAGWLLILAGCVAASVWLGRRSDRLARVPRLVLVAGSIFLVFAAMLGFATADRAKRGPYIYTNYVNHNPYQEVWDVYVYDRDGRLLQDVTLVDQHGNPIILGGTDSWCGEPRSFDATRYPRCPANAPGVRYGRPVPSPVPTAIPSPTPTAPASPVSGTG